jgi:hypothetical protein
MNLMLTKLKFAEYKNVDYCDGNKETKLGQMKITYVRKHVSEFK